MSSKLPAGRRPADRLVTRPTRAITVPARTATARVQSRPAAPNATSTRKRAGVTMDYQLGFTSGPSA